MNAAASRFEQRREQLIGRLEELVRSDTRIAALWLQGSLAAGTADPLSDVDAYVAIEDAAFEEVFQERAGFLGRLGTILTWTDTTIPGLTAIHCVLDGPVKLDVFFERVSESPGVDRPAVWMLIDKIGLQPSLKTGWKPSTRAAAARMDAIFRGTRQGCTWPIRLLLRGQWSTFAMCELEVVNDNLATLLAVQLDPALLFHNRFSYPRLLRADQRELLDSLTAALLQALADRDLAALRDVHLRISDALVREGRAAYACLGLPYPDSEAGDAAIRAFYEREWPAQLPAQA